MLTLLTELREIVSPADQVRFDQMVYHSDRRRPFEHSPYGSAFSAGGLMVGQVIKSVDGRRLVGVNHQRAAQLIAEAYANKNKPDIEFVVRELKRSAFNVRHCAPDLTPD
ncbi:Whirlin [Amphibalanus amphitrite]|uniref:Whirlin n=1 Tax=Amphibalanus amphitrite TaxID=1232801 RepID=A0A6A4W236_AMPAM|nr:Whirlin [Amphibalanus amphitrite]